MTDDIAVGDDSVGLMFVSSAVVSVAICKEVDVTAMLVLVSRL